ncbi:hypothetical protein GGF46_001743 [Coemansia sp. RSA 552]|nr:hypothetical protein GGF46_001743 [Coemansia sp. RSA 552]
MSTINLAGLLIYRISPRRPIEYLLLNDAFDNHRHWYPPKGRMIGSEDELKCALRESLDLTGLGAGDLVADEAFRAELKYVDGIQPKQVVYFLARLAAPSRQGSIRSDSAGMKYQWCTLDQAVDRAVFQSMQNILTQAESYIEDMRDKILGSSRPRRQNSIGDEGSRRYRANGSQRAYGSGRDETSNGIDPSGGENGDIEWRPARANHLGGIEGRMRKLAVHDEPRGGNGYRQGQLPSGSPHQWREQQDRGAGDDGMAAHVRRQQDNPRYKTKLCEKFEQEGECPYGHKCVFAHGPGELRAREPAPSFNGLRVPGDEREREGYQRNHQGSAAGLRYNSNPLYKTKMCQRFSELGECPYGEKCQFAHGDDELRDPPEVSPPMRSPRDARAQPRVLADHQTTNGLGRAGLGQSQAWRKNSFDNERVAAPRMGRNISWSNTGAQLVDSSGSPSMGDDGPLLEPSSFQTARSPKARYSSDQAELGAPQAAPLVTPIAQKIPSPRAGGNSTVAPPKKPQEHRVGGTGTRGGKNGDEKPWIKVVEVTNKDLKEMGSPLVDSSDAPKHKPSNKTAELEGRLIRELAEAVAQGSGAGDSLTQHALFKEITHLEFRNNLTKQQLLNIVIPVLFSPCKATGVAEAIEGHAEVLGKIVGKQQDQKLMLNAWQRLLVEDACASLWQRKATELLGTLYKESLLDEDAFFQWFAKWNVDGCGPEIQAMKPFAHWLNTAEEE